MRLLLGRRQPGGAASDTASLGAVTPDQFAVWRLRRAARCGAGSSLLEAGATLAEARKANCLTSSATTRKKIQVVHNKTGRAAKVRRISREAMTDSAAGSAPFGRRCLAQAAPPKPSDGFVGYSPASRMKVAKASAKCGCQRESAGRFSITSPIAQAMRLSSIARVTSLSGHRM